MSQLRKIEINSTDVCETLFELDTSKAPAFLNLSFHSTPVGRGGGGGGVYHFCGEKKVLFVSYNIMCLHTCSRSFPHLGAFGCSILKIQ